MVPSSPAPGSGPACPWVCPPTTGSTRVGQLRRGESFEALAEVRGSDWILVGQDGVGVGYVNNAFVEPEGRRYAQGY